MTELKTTIKVCIEPRFLDYHLNDNILKQLQNKYLNKCNKDFGYISEIKPDFTIINNSLSRLGGNVFYTVECVLVCIKPDVGNKFSGKIIHTYENGILVEIADKMKVLVPTDKMTGYKYCKDSEMFKKGVKKVKTIKNNDTVEVEITSVQYVDGNYSLIGKLA